MNQESKNDRQIVSNALVEDKGDRQRSLVAGVDEVGRGALFGPVVAAACVFEEDAVADLAVWGIRDSKQLSCAKRDSLATRIRAIALDCQIGSASVEEIDQLNILQASLLAMKRAVLALEVRPHLCLIDGNQRIPDLSLPQQTMVKGDARNLAIASASILAKVWRDRLIVSLAEQYPQYDLAANKGYGTLRHKAALKTYGTSVLHRKSFRF